MLTNPFQQASSDRKPVEIGANLFIGSLDPEVNENLLHTAFSNFGTQTQPARVCCVSLSNTVEVPQLANHNNTQIARDDNFVSKGHGFVYYDSFEAADQAIESMNGQYLMNKPIVVQYAYKKDGKGERHGSQAERLLAAQARKNNGPSFPDQERIYSLTSFCHIKFIATAIPQNNFAPPPPPSAPFMPPTGFSAPPGLPGMPSMQQPGPPVSTLSFFLSHNVASFDLTLFCFEARLRSTTTAATARVCPAAATWLHVKSLDHKKQKLHPLLNAHCISMPSCLVTCCSS